jgi:hypothetical protein
MSKEIYKKDFFVTDWEDRKMKVSTLIQLKMEQVNLCTQEEEEKIIT